MPDLSEDVARALPKAIKTLEELTEHEDPEIAGRAAAALLRLAPKELRVTHAVEKLSDEELVKQLEAHGVKVPVHVLSCEVAGEGTSSTNENIPSDTGPDGDGVRADLRGATRDADSRPKRGAGRRSGGR